ncbi:MAG: Mo-dependent nitrogenase C-terminal domain-containing protein [Cyanobacteria bacterium J06592_8]
MTRTAQSPYTDEQTTAWIRGLLTLALADGQFDAEEQELIVSLTHEQLGTDTDISSLEPIAPQELAVHLGKETHVRENFLRTAVMVALADGIYSVCEDDLMHQFCHALDLNDEVLKSLRHTLEDLNAQADADGSLKLPEEHHLDVLHPVKHWLDDWDVHDPKVARFICKMIPPQCPFERDVTLFGRKIVHIPPMCKLNPLYEQLVGLRFRALSYLADDCQEDISKYI